MTDVTIEQYMKLPYAVNVVPDVCTDGTQCYLASNPELPGCMSHGANVEEAILNLQGARRLYIKTLLKRNLPIPLPEGMQDGTVVTSPVTRVEWRVVTHVETASTATHVATTRTFRQTTGDGAGRIGMTAVH